MRGRPKAVLPWKAEEGERGAALVWLAFMMTFLIGVAAFAVDLGWLYVNSSRIQRAADAAALGHHDPVPVSVERTGCFLGVRMAGQRSLVLESREYAEGVGCLRDASSQRQINVTQKQHLHALRHTDVAGSAGSSSPAAKAQSPLKMV